MATCSTCIEHERATDNHTDIARNALVFFTAAIGSPKGDFKQSAAQFLRALAHLADEENFELADSLKEAWSGYHDDTDSEGKQFVAAASTLGTEMLKEYCR
jgi:hypothetical protein